MPRMGHDKSRQTSITLNPAEWGMIGWTWLALFVFSGAGIFAILYQASVAPQTSGTDQTARRSAGEHRADRAGIDTGPSDYRASADLYRSESGRRQQSSGNPGDAARASTGRDGNKNSGVSSQFPKVFEGQHQNRTTPFEGPGKMRLSWETDGPMIQIMVKRSDGSTVTSAVSKSGLNGHSNGSTTVNANGTIYLKVNAIGKWSIKIEA